MFSQIHEIIFHGNGGYDWETVYNMPIWLRNFTYKKIEEYYRKQTEKINEQQNIITQSTPVDKLPGIKPSKKITNSYNTKVSQK